MNTQDFENFDDTPVTIFEAIQCFFIAIFMPILILCNLHSPEEFERLEAEEKAEQKAIKEAERRQRQMQRQAEREALRQEREAQRAASKPAPEIPSQDEIDAISALRSLGFTQKAAKERMKIIFRDNPSASTEEAVKMALKR